MILVVSLFSAKRKKRVYHEKSIVIFQSIVSFSNVEYIAVKILILKV